jgi:hypothetical protein
VCPAADFDVGHTAEKTLVQIRARFERIPRLWVDDGRLECEVPETVENDTAAVGLDAAEPVRTVREDDVGAGIDRAPASARSPRERRGDCSAGGCER